MDSETCCIEAHPGNPAACGLTAAEAATLMAAGVGATGTHGQEEVWDDSHNADLPEWKRECIRFYGDCKAQPGWKGPCYDCMRQCEGQKEWPLDMCRPGRRTRRP
ncbi:hypothetical protein D7V97_18355 [Corallococcus sp. CA053C]|nr:hypothetical protein D7V97_18355 [Corallococcus sp. CA053C]